MTPSPAATVCLVGSSRKTDASMKSWPTVPTVKSPAATSTLRLIGSRMRAKAAVREAPSTNADSSISRGRCWKYADSSQTQNGSAIVE